MVYAELARIKVGDAFPVCVAGVINVSPESFYKGSVQTSREEIERAALKMIEEGAAFIDVGAASTAPYLQTEISVEEEKKRIEEAVEILCDVADVPVSIDSKKSEAVEAGVKAGASIVNDVSGFKNDARIARIVAENGLSAILMAQKGMEQAIGSPIQQIIFHLKQSLEIARNAGIDGKKLVLDPGIGFFREEGIAWHEWDVNVLKNLKELKVLERPILIAVSRKSFIGQIVAGAKDPADRLPGSLAATTIAVYNGASVVRTHDVKETIQAVKIAERVNSA